MQSQSLKTSPIKRHTKNAVILKEQKSIVLNAGPPSSCGLRKQERQAPYLRTFFFFFIIIFFLLIDCRTHTSYITLKLTFNYIAYTTYTGALLTIQR